MGHVIEKNSRLFWCVIISLNLIVPLLVIEIGLRYVYVYWKPYYTPETLREVYLQYDPSIFSQHTFSPRKQTAQGWGGRYEINELGYRGVTFQSDKPAGTTRIVFLGGSSVFDSQADIGRDWPHLVADKLKAEGFSNVESINAGTPGHTTFDAVGRLYSEIHTFQPDIVVLYCTWNDIKYFTSPLTLLRDYKPIQTDYRFNYFGPIDRFLCEYSQLYVKVRNRYILAGVNFGFEGKIEDVDFMDSYNPAKIKQYRLNLEMFVDCVKNIGAIPILMTEVRLPSLDNTEEEKKKIGYVHINLTHEKLCEAYAVCDSIIQAVAEQKRVPFIDASHALSGRSELLVDHVHLMPQGSQLLSDLVAKQIATLLKNEIH